MQKIMRKGVSVFLAFMMMFNTVLPSLAYAETMDIPNIEINDPSISELNEAFEKEAASIVINEVEETNSTTGAGTVVDIEEPVVAPEEEPVVAPGEEPVVTPEVIPATPIEEIAKPVTTTGAATTIEASEVSKSEFIVKLKEEEVDSFLSLSATFDAEALGVEEDDLKVTKIIDEFQVLEVNDAINIDSVIETIEKDENIEYIQPNYALELYSLDSGYSKQWGLNNIGQVINGQKGNNDEDVHMDYAWNFTKGENVLVGVLDTGIDIQHNELKDRIYTNINEIPNNKIDDDDNGYVDDVNGWDFYNYDNSVYDSGKEDAHGTHVAGIIAASNNGTGVIGVSPEVTILPMKFIDNKGGYTSDVLEAISYAEKMGVDIINCSFGSYEENQALQEAIENSNILFVAATGNDGKDLSKEKVYPASYQLDNVISVGASTNNGLIAAFSNYGDVDVYAPGSNILSIYPDNKYAFENGTSESAGFVTGALALLKSNEASLDAAMLKSRLLDTSRSLSNDGIRILDIDKLVLPKDADLSGLTKLSSQPLTEETLDIINESSVTVTVPNIDGLDPKSFRTYSLDGFISNDLKETLVNLGVAEDELFIVAKSVDVFRLTEDEIKQMLNKGLKFNTYETHLGYYEAYITDKMAYFSDVRKALINGVDYKTFRDGVIFAEAFGISVDSILYDAKLRTDIDLGIVNEDHEIVAKWLDTYSISKEAIAYISYTLGYSYLELDEMLTVYLENPSDYVPKYLLDAFEVITFDKESDVQTVDINGEVKGEKLEVVANKKVEKVDIQNNFFTTSSDAETVEKLLDLEKNYKFTYGELESALNFYRTTDAIEEAAISYQAYLEENEDTQDRAFIKQELLRGVTLDDAKNHLRVNEKEETPADFKLFSTSSSSNRVVSVDKFINTGFIFNEGNNVNINTVDGSMEFKLLLDELTMLDGSSIPLFLRYQSSRAMENEPGFNGYYGKNDTGKIIDEINRFSIAPGWSIQMSYFDPGNVYYANKPWAEVYKFMDFDSIHLMDGRTLAVEKESDTKFKFTDEDIKDVRLEVCDTLAERNEFSNGQTFSIMAFSNGQWDQRPSLKVIHNNGTVEYFNYYGYLLGVSNKNGNGYLVQYKVDQVRDMKYVYPQALVSSTYDIVNFDMKWGMAHNVEITTGTKKFILDKDYVDDSIGLTDIEIQNRENPSDSEHYRFEYEFNDVDFTLHSRLSSKGLDAVRMMSITYPTGAKAEFDYYTERVDIGVGGYIQKPFVYDYKLKEGNKTYLAKTYDTNGDWTVENQSNGLVNKYYYDDDYLVTKIETSDGSTLKQTVINTYSNKQLTKKVTRYHQTNSKYREVVESYKYDSKGNMTEYTNPNGDVSKFTYDDKYAMILKSEVPLGNGKTAKTEFTLDDNGNYATKKEYSSTTDFRETTYTVQEQGLLLREFTENDQLDYIVKYGYNISPKIGFKEGENFHAAVYSKKWTDNKITQNADGTTKYVKYESEIDPTTKQIKSLTEPNGNKTTYTYDYKGRITKVTNPDGTTKTVTYNDASKYYIVKSPSGSKMKFVYDGFGSLLREQEYFQGNYRTTHENEYNAEYLVSRERDALGNSTSYAYDTFGRVIQSTYSDGTTARYEMDDYANTVKMYDQENDWTLSTYDNLSNLVEESKSVSGNVVKNKYTYDNAGNVLTATDAKGAKYTYDYDLLGQVLKVTDPNGSVSNYRYDKLGSLKLTQQKDADYNRTFQKQFINNQFGNPILSQDERGKNTKYWYDDNSNLIQHLDPNGETESYKYDSRNNITEITYPSYKKTFDYDENGQLETAKVFDSLTASLPSKTFSYVYNDLDQLQRRTSNDGKYVEYTYDANGNVKTLRDYFGGVTTYGYNSMNLLKTVNYANKTFTYDYYPDGTIKEITYPVANYKASFTYDEANRIKSVTNKKGSAVQKAFEYNYDTVGNLTEIKENNAVKAQGGYDKLGQLKALNFPGNTINYYYDVRGNMVAQIGRNPIELTYDLGDYTWNSEDLLTKFTANSGNVTTYSYDERGLRQTKQNSTENIQYYYDANSRLVNEVANGQQITVVNGHLPLMRKVGSSIYYYVYNGHGDVIGLLDQNGTMVNEYTYDIWGELTSSREGVHNDLKYTSEVYDKETHNYYLRARYYSPETHRFISVDTYEGELKNPLTMNQNIYCLNNPLIYVDPSGHKHIVSDYVFTTYEKVYGYGSRGNGYVLNPISTTVEKHEFTNLNVTVYGSGTYKSVLADGAELNGYHSDALSASQGERICATDSEGTYYLDIESLAHLDEEYGNDKRWLGGKIVLSFSADVVATLSGYKALSGSLKAGKPLLTGTYAGTKAMLSPGKDITGVNFAVTQTENIVQNKSTWDKARGFIANFIPFKGTVDGVKELRSNDPKVNIGN